MKAGRSFSLALIGLTGAVTAIVGVVLEMLAGPQSAGPAVKALMLAGAAAAVSAVVLIPCGLLLDRTLDRVRKYVEEAASKQQGITFAGPRWMRSVTRAFTGAVDEFRQREQSLRCQLRDLEIRHHVSEAERRQIEAVLHSLRDAVLVTDAFDEIVMANDAAASILGFKLAHALHKPINQLIDDARLCGLIADMRENGHVNEARHVEHDLVVRLRDGREGQAVFDVGLSCVENHKHEVAGVVTILHDLTRERELSQMKSDFVSKASHELRTPLSSIRAYVEMLVDGEASDEAARQEFYRIIHDETDRLSRLIDNMLNISRIEAGIVQIEREQVDIRVIIERAVNTLEPQARDKEITMNKRVADVDLCVEGDADMLYQVVLNLVSNAVKYTPDGGRITISADSDNLTRSVVVSVADTGLGIPPDALPRLFEKFFRVDNYKRVAKGTGLGLSLCKHIVETVHHGQIGVQSKLGMGSKFWFSVPMRYAGSQAAA